MEDGIPVVRHHQFSPDSECVKCRYLPFCIEPYPKRREEMYAEHQRIVCQHSDRDATMEKAIVEFCESNSDFYDL